ncbi:ABC transporter substrate-binding protein [Imhoffiella purpurea]|uniref:Spermidine/putrescine-binding protein n=1 Tax=Imhoffiella purpurea TaxID=1249627 RepID=W9VT07_9GAMM|nr:ABC transporter substrate-binding protein [Imhoffiella purpurea]EXJ13510.1 Spermidine/putrescine-binding protein [Imhoffiella purpurea]
MSTPSHHSLLSSVPSARAPAELPPTREPETQSDLGRLDLLGRLPIPLRRPFKAGLDRTVIAHRRATGTELECRFLSGAEWYSPFDGLAGAPDAEALPGMLVTTLYQDILVPRLLAHYTPAPERRPASPCHPSCLDGGLMDPFGIFRTFSVIPFVFLVDERRLKGRPAPRTWSDLLHPRWTDDIVFGGWRPNDRVPYQDYNAYLLLCLAEEFGRTGLEAFAGNVRHLQHNIRTATQAGSNSAGVGAVSVLPWLQAVLCPRRDRTRVVWPEDGALAMPIGYLVKPDAEARLAPLIDYVTGLEWGAALTRNCYPPTNPAVPNAFPPGARLKWPGWDYCRAHDLGAETDRASQCFFDAWYGRMEVRACS